MRDLRLVTHHLEHRLNLNSMLMPNPSNMMCIETPEGFVLVDRSMPPKAGDAVAYQLEDYPQVGKIFPSGIITQDGETIDEAWLEGQWCWVKLPPQSWRFMNLYNPPSNSAI